MTDYIKKIRTTDGDKQIDYNALANLPKPLEIDSTLKKSGVPADAKVVGEELISLNNNLNELDSFVHNELGLAIKGVVSGTNIKITDISPIEHELSISLHGKNFWNCLNIPIQTDTTNTLCVVSNCTADSVTIVSGTQHTGNGYCRLGVTLREICPQLVAGKEYTLQASSSALNQMIYLEGVDVGWGFNETRVVTENMLDGIVVLYGLNAMKGQGKGSVTISNIQIEEGSEITEYSSYVNPSNGSVTYLDNTYPADQDGRVVGIMSQYPYMNLGTPDNLIITVSYNQNPTAIISKIINAIQALGGTI